jgi:hypothetical protein
MKKLDISKASPSQKVKILKYAAETRRFEIERFWQRSTFFWAFIGAAFVAYATLYTKEDVALIIGCFGLVSSVAWTLQNRGSKYWQEAWEQKVEVVELEILGAKLFSNWEPMLEKGFWGARLYSVSKLAIAISDFTVVVWAVLIGETFPSIRGLPISFSKVALAATAIFIVLLFTWGQTRSPYRSSRPPRHLPVTKLRRLFKATRSE